MSLFDPGIIAALDSDGVTISGATWSFYLTGTSTPQAVYSNSTLLTSVGSTITADSAGRWSPVFLDDTKLYRAIQKDAGGTTLFDIDPLNDGFNGLTSRISTAETNITALQTQITTVSGSANRNGLLNGGQVVWETGYTFRVSAASYYINGMLYTSLEQTVTLTAADGTNPRIDVIYIDTSGVVGKETGTAAVNPSEPDIAPGTQLKLTFVYVPAASTAPVGVSNESVYLENTEWTSSTSGTGFNAAGTTNPYAGTKCIEGTTVATAAYVQLQRGSSLTLDSYQFLAMFVRSKAAWASGRVLRVQFYASGVAKGVPVTIASGFWGFDSSITSGYQQVAIPLSQFVLPAGTSVNQLRITDSGGSIGFYIDNIVLQTQDTALSQGTGGLTQDLADARYLQRANNLSDLNNAATARTNLGITSANVKLTESFVIACSDETTALTTGTGKVTFRIPYAFTVSAVRASLTTAQTSGLIFTVDINEAGTTILSTKLTIDNTEKTSTTAATAAVISDTSLADDAEISIDIDQIGDGTAKGLKVVLIGTRT